MLPPLLLLPFGSRSRTSVAATAHRSRSRKQRKGGGRSRVPHERRGMLVVRGRRDGGVFRSVLHLLTPADSLFLMVSTRFPCFHLTLDAYLVTQG